MFSTQATFWKFLDQLLIEHPIVIDRRRATAHPVYPDLIYPLDYGYLQGTMSGDGGGIDVWLGTLPGKSLMAVMLTIDLGKRDAEIKLMVNCTEEEIERAASFLSSEHMQVQIVQREWQPLKWISSRRSVRRFSTQTVPPETLSHVLQTACTAPSAHNRQPWRFVVIHSHEARVELADAMGSLFQNDLVRDGFSMEEAIKKADLSRRRMLDAPVVILICLDQDELDVYPDPERQAASLTMMVQSVAMAGQNLLLAAHAAGLGAVWVCAPLFAAQAASQALRLPESWLPQGLVYLGYPDVWPEARPRRPLQELTLYME